MIYVLLWIVCMAYTVFFFHCLVSAGRTKEEQAELDREQAEILDRARKG